MATLLVMVMLRATVMLRALQLLIRVMPKFHARTSRHHHFQVVFGVKAYRTAMHTECTQAWLRGVYEIHNSGLVSFPATNNSFSSRFHDVLAQSTEASVLAGGWVGS
jgi:hypothetical protein